MSNVVKPELVSVEVSEFSHNIKAKVKIGKCEWQIVLENNETASKPYEYAVGLKEFQNLKETLASIDTIIDELCLDEFIKANLDSFWKEKQEKQDEEKRLKAEQEKIELANLRAELTRLFPKYRFDFHSTSYVIISDGISTVTLSKDSWSKSQAWKADFRKYDYSHSRRYCTHGELKSSKSLSKLVDAVNQELAYKTGLVNHEKDKKTLAQRNDELMLSLGYQLGGTPTYERINKETNEWADVPNSCNGMVYKKDNVSFYVKRNKEDVLEIISYTVEKLNVPVDTFKM
jgi:hypothetical protein